MNIVLAPMEGVIDYQMRDTLTRLGGYTRCVTEFIRVSDRRLPPKVFYRMAPELKTSSRTASGTEVAIQLLGGKPQPMAENARQAARFGASIIDLNFGCPAKTVNRHDGGASLLKTPHRLYDIVKTVREELPPPIRLTAKIRLGYDDKSLAIENALAIEEAGASELTVHARTKQEGYKPPAHWEWIARIKEEVSLNLIANGDIWDIDSYLRCREITDCKDVMLGRGAVRNPDLALQIQHHCNQNQYQAMNWQQRCELILSYLDRLNGLISDKYLAGRAKQWVGMMAVSDPDAALLFGKIKRETDLQQILLLINKSKK